VIPISEHLDEDWSVLNSVGTGPLNSLFDHEDVLTINLEAWDLVSSGVEFGVVTGALLRSSHTIRVVLTQVDDRKLPKTGHVRSLKELTLVRGTITVHSDGEVLLVAILLCEGKSSADGHLSTNNTVATVVVALSVVVVH